MGKSAEEILEEVRLKAKKAAKVYNHCTPNETLGESIFMSGVDFVISAIEQQPLPVGGYREAEQWKKFAEWTASEYWFYYTNLKVWQKSFDDGIHDKFTTEQLYNLFKSSSPNQEQGEKQEQNPG